jgi:hypothetical protein
MPDDRSNVVAEDDWYGLYRGGWPRELLVPDAFSHPAKVRFKLAEKIYAHAAEEGWLKGVVLDPFAGVGGFAFRAMMHGQHFVGIELEPRFVEYASANVELWKRRFGHQPGFGSASIIQGDSRRLAEILYGAEVLISSPPYSRLGTHFSSNSIDESKLKRPGGPATQIHCDDYGSSSGQLGQMKEGNYDLAISSPPFASSTGSDEPEKRGGLYADPKRAADRNLTGHYSEDAAQLGGMRDQGLDAVMVSSPPYETGGHHKHQMDSWNANGRGQRGHSGGYASESEDQMANNFWLAARQILEHAYAILSPNSHAIFVLKSYIRAGKVVDFPDNWRRLCEAVGFKTLHIHRAWMVTKHGEQHRLDGGTDEIKISSKSFFRTLQERRGSPKIDFEIVLCMERFNC